MDGFTFKNKEEYIMNYLGKFLPSTADVCEPLRQLISSKSEWGVNRIDQNLNNKTKNIIKKNVNIVFYNKKEQV